MLLLELVHLLQVILNPGHAAVRLLVGGVVPVLVGRLVPAALQIGTGIEVAGPSGGHRAGNQRAGVGRFYRLRPLQVARHHVVVGGGLW